MASRDKKPLAPSKSKQKVNNDSGLPSNDSKNKKGKTLPTLKQQQLAHELFEAVATGSQLPRKIEASVPRKKVLRQLTQKQKLKASKSNIIKSKVTKRVPNKNLRSIISPIEKGVRTKKLKQSPQGISKVIVKHIKISENHINHEENESKGIESTSKSNKSIRVRKSKSTKAAEELESEDNLDTASEGSTKTSPKLNAKVSFVEALDPASRSAKSIKLPVTKKNTTKDLKSLEFAKPKKGCGKDKETHIDNIIDEVVASSMNDSEFENQQTEISAIKKTRGKKMLIGGTLLTDNEIKKELENEEVRLASDEELVEMEQSPQLQNTIQLRKRSSTSMSQRSLRNGKLRQLSDSGISTDLEIKRRKRLNSDERVTAENSEHISESNVDTESNFSESSGIESHTVTSKDDSNSSKSEITKSFEEDNDNGLEIETYNCNEKGEMGPKLRSRTKVRSTDTDMKQEEVKQENPRGKTSDIADDARKNTNLDQTKKDVSLCRPRNRRNSLNIEIKKPVSSFYSADKSDVKPKSQIDQMIENIKLTIAKSIESKIYGPEKGLGISKNFEIPKIEEIVAPLSTESQKLGLEETVDEDKPNVSKSDKKSESAENSVPKVADTAKEIEKLVMGDMEVVEIHSQNVENSESSDKDSTAKNGESEMEVDNDALEETLASSSVQTSTSEKKEEKSPPASPPKLEKIDDSTDEASAVVEPTDATERLSDTTETAPISHANEPEATRVPISEEPETLESISLEVERLVNENKDNTISNFQEDNENDNVSLSSDIVLRLDESVTSMDVDGTEAPTNVKSIEPENCDYSSGAIETIASPSTSVTEQKVDSESSLQTNQNSANDLPVKKTDGDKVLEEKEVSKTNLEVEIKMGINSSNDKSSDKMSESQKSITDENRRVLRARDRQRNKQEKRWQSTSRERFEKSKLDEEVQNTPSGSGTQSPCDEKVDEVATEPRTRRSREAKRRREESVTPSNRAKQMRREKKTTQQNKEETLLDNEVATINENKQLYLDEYSENSKRTEKFRGYSEGGQIATQDKQDKTRSKSESDLGTVNEENDITSEEPKPNCSTTPDADAKTDKPEISQKDLDEASTSGDSSSSGSLAKILETPEDKERKESILRILGLESLEKAAERQKAKKEQVYTGTLKTVIRVQKDKDSRDKKRSRSPLKMVLKQGRGDGEGDSPDFYTIQKEYGTSGLGDSSSGANRKFTTNHRHSCDEDNEESTSKDRQSLVIPEKSSSFSIHPERLCADVCCYCFGKFGSLDTPMHLAQMKSDERRKKILSIEKHLTKDSCLCDACYRHVDRKANTSPANMQAKPQKQHRQLMVPKCSARECKDAARHHVKRRWLLKIKSCLKNQVIIDWESNQHSSMPFCVIHYAKVEKYLTCALCRRRLARNSTQHLLSSEIDELNEMCVQLRIPVILTAGTLVCKLCRYYTTLQLKYKVIENMNANHKSFYKNYSRRILHSHNIEIPDSDDESNHVPIEKEKEKDKEKRKKSKCSQNKTGNPKSPEATPVSISEESTPEPAKNETTITEVEVEKDGSIASTSKETCSRIDELMEGFEKLKKRNLLTVESYIVPCDRSNEGVEIVAMDKEVTLTRLPKKPRTNNDITPVVQRLGANPSISVRTLFPGEEEMNLHANIEFTNVREITPQGWEKCATVIQYDRDTKILWQELQRPYGNQSSFLRHLILLEKYYRSGDLLLAPNASRNAINYSTSVKNRLISYEGPEKVDEPITEPIFDNTRRLSGGYIVERDRLSLPSTSTGQPTTSVQSKSNAGNLQQRVVKLNAGVSIIKKQAPSATLSNGNAKRKDSQKATSNPTFSGGKVFQLSETEFKRLQNLKKQKQKHMLGDKSSVGLPTATSTPASKSSAQYQKAQLAAQNEFQKHLRMQQEMLSRQSRGDFEPLICDIRSLANENSPTQNLINNLNLPKSIQVTTKPSNPIPILPKIPKSLTVIPQTITRPTDK